MTAEQGRPTAPDAVSSQPSTEEAMTEEERAALTPIVDAVGEWLDSRRVPISHIWLAVDQDDTTLVDMGGDLVIAAEYSQLRKFANMLLTGRTFRTRSGIEAHYPWKVAHYSQNVLAIVNGLSVEHAVPLADEMLKRYNLGAEFHHLRDNVAAPRFLNRPITISALIWLPTVEELRGFGFGSRNAERRREAEMIQRNVFQRLRGAYEGYRDERRDTVGDRYAPIAQIFWIDPQDPHVIHTAKS